jgi:hypothetical protein
MPHTMSGLSIGSHVSGHVRGRHSLRMLSRLQVNLLEICLRQGIMILGMGLSLQTCLLYCKDPGCHPLQTDPKRYFLGEVLGGLRDSVILLCRDRVAGEADSSLSP